MMPGYRDPNDFQETTMNLYDVSQSIRDLIDSSEDGELTDEVLGRLDGLELEFDAKLDGICGLCADLESEAAVKEAKAEQFACEARRLNAGASAQKAKAFRLREWLRFNLERRGLKKRETALWS